MSYPYVQPVTPQARVNGLTAAIRMGQLSWEVAEITRWQLATDPATRELKPCALHPEAWRRKARGNERETR